MGREVRKVPADWQHPKDERGRYKPLFALASHAEPGLSFRERCERQPTAWATPEPSVDYARGLEDALAIVSVSSGVPQAAAAIRAKIKPTKGGT